MRGKSCCDDDRPISSTPAIAGAVDDIAGWSRYCAAGDPDLAWLLRLLRKKSSAIAPAATGTPIPTPTPTPTFSVLVIPEDDVVGTGELLLFAAPGAKFDRLDGDGVLCVRVRVC